MGMHIRKGGKFMKLKKKSGLMGAVIALSAASLVSVGFASWVISQGDTIVADGTILVDNVDNQNHEILDDQSGWVSSKNGGTINNDLNKIVYGASADALSSTGWLKNDGKLQGSETQSSAAVLTAWYMIKVNNVKATDKYGDIIQSVTFEEPANYETARTAGYVGAFPTPKAYIAGEEASSTSVVGADGLIVFEFNFTWGSLTNNGDPFAYWNAKTITVGETEGDYPTANARATAAANYFAGLQTALTGVTYSCTITTK